MWARRTDQNHAEIRDAMRKAGAEVEDLSGSGRGMLLVEIKMPKGTLTAPQVRFHARFPVHIVRSVEAALALVADPDPDSHDETTYNEIP
jgi:hypothetical protein